MSSPCANPPDGSRTIYPFCAEFELVLGNVETCPLRDEVSSAEEVRQENVGDGCHVDATIPNGDGSRVVHIEDAVESACPCPVFRQHGCIPNVKSVTDEGFVVEVYIPNRDILRSCVDSLRDRVASIELRHLRMDPNPANGEADSVLFHLQDLTEKQRIAAVRALSAGYYECPRQTSLEELATEIGISKSALSQRLTAVEAKLAKAAFSSDCE